MHSIEPYYRWIPIYDSSEDERSPFYGREYSEFEFSNTVYNYYIHPRWDEFGSETLYVKVLFVDYKKGYVIIEMLGEWNDCIYNDISNLKREVIDPMIDQGIDKFILIGENVLNFHVSDDCYYEEWFSEIEAGWIAAINFREHVEEEFKSRNIDYYLNFGGTLSNIPWRTMKPDLFFERVNASMQLRLGE